MPVRNSIQDRAPYFAEIRRELHQTPELGFDTKNTAAIVKRELAKMGIHDVHTMAQNGLVAVIEGKEKGRVIGFRADMDALPIQEQTGKDYASKSDGTMHACGHDGHTASLLAAAEQFSARDFVGTVVLIFQPAEEGGGGANVMVEEGLIEKFGIEEIYAWHNLPGAPFGQFEMCKGPIMASTDTIQIWVRGEGGHAAFPDTTIDPIPMAMRLIDGLYTIPARMIPAASQAVLSITQIHAGSADNIIPDEVYINGTIRTLDPTIREMITTEVARLATELPRALGGEGRVRIHDGYPVTVNHDHETEIAARAARQVSADVITERPAEMGAEDFAFMLEKTPGAYVFIGAGEGAALHNAAYDFNDDLIPYAASWFVELVQARLK